MAETVTGAPLTGSTASEGKIGLDVLERMHPEIDKVQDQWKRIEVLFKKEEEKYTDPGFFFPLPNEKPAAQEKRKRYHRSGFVNPTQNLITSKAGFVFKKQIHRKFSDEALTRFTENCDLSGQTIDQFMKNQISPALSAYGTAFAVIDKPSLVARNREEELRNGLPYICKLNNSQIRDWFLGPDGEFVWFRYMVTELSERVDAFSKKLSTRNFFVTWTRDRMFKHSDKGKQVQEPIQHNFGVVPIVTQAAFQETSKKVLGKSSFFDSSRYIIMANFHNSNADHELAKFASAIVVASREDFSDDVVLKEKNPDSNERMLTKSSHELDDVWPVEDMANMPQYLTKDLEAQAAMVERYNHYMDMSVENERDAKSVKNDMAVPESGMSKSYDFAEIESNLADHAGDLESFEGKAYTVIEKIMGSNSDRSHQYPRKFDVHGFNEHMNRVGQMTKLGYPSETGMIQAWQNTTPDITNNPAQQKKINNEIKTAVSENFKLKGNKDGANPEDGNRNSPQGQPKPPNRVPGGSGPSGSDGKDPNGKQ